MSAQVLFARHDRVGLITLNRPEKLNAFADRMRDELPDALDRERTNQMRLFRSADARAAMRAFLDTRIAAHGHKT